MKKGGRPSCETEVSAFFRRRYALLSATVLLLGFFLRVYASDRRYEAHAALHACCS